ncbi:MAG: pitrilysin family protein [Cyclobacteriaceae bacterium]|nr:pitrilysin family protein [Cyclobacteriaceae bacterium]
MVTIEFIFRSGIWFEVTPGQAYFTARMLSEGTKSFSSADLAAKLDFYGAFIEIHPGFDYVKVAVHLPARHLENVLVVMDEILFEPVFHERELELMKQIQLNQLQVNLQKNSYLASKDFRSLLYTNHPYGHTPTKETIEAIHPDALKEYYQNSMQGKFDVFLTGKFDDNVPVLLESMMKNRMKPMHEFHPQPAPEVGYFDRYLEKTGSLQSALYLGKRCVNRNHPEYPRVLLLNEVFGGYFGSRLMQNIREDKGYTYGIHSHMVHLKNDSYFVIGTEVKKEAREATLREIQMESERLKSDLIPSAELDEARNHLKGSILNSLTSPTAVADKLKNIRFYDLPEDYYSQLFDDIDAATPASLQELANTLLFNSSLSRVAVG